LSQRSQDVRQQAAVEGGVVEVTPGEMISTAIVGTPWSVILRLNTKSMQVDGVQLYFDIKGKFSETPTINILSQSGLQLIANKVDQTSDGYRARLIAIANPGQPYVNNNETDFLKIEVIPSEPEDFQIVFDQEDSQSTQYKSTPVKDVLKPINTISVDVVAEVENTPVPTEAATPTPSPTNEPTPTPTERASSTPTPTPIADNGTGGKTPQSCGGSCFIDEDCANRLVCYFGQCRLGSNPTNDRCVDPPDTGIHNVCNEYCSNTGECQEGLTCYFNRCRNPRNVTNSSCAEPASRSTTTGGTTSFTDSSDDTSSDPDDEYIADISDVEDNTSDEIMTDEGTFEEDSITINEDQDSEFTPVEDESLTNEEDSDTSLESEAQDETNNPLNNVFMLIIGGLSLLAVLVTASVVYMAKKGDNIPKPILKTDNLEHPIQSSTTSSSMNSFAGNLEPRKPDDNS
jgi:hypothetical protein